MAQLSRVLVYIACSFDGFIAGPGDDLSWLPGADPNSADAAQAAPPEADSKALGFQAFLSGVGALHRALQPVAPEVRGVDGEIAQLVALAREAAGERDVYLDGGNLIRQALDADLVDELVVTMVPVLLGEGYPLFAGVRKRHALEFVSHQRFAGGLLQVQLRPKARASSS